MSNGPSCDARRRNGIGAIAWRERFSDWWRTAHDRQDRVLDRRVQIQPSGDNFSEIGADFSCVGGLTAHVFSSLNKTRRGVDFWPM